MNKKEIKIMQKWKYWNTKFNKLLDKNPNSKAYQIAFYKVQVMDTCLKKLTTGDFRDKKQKEFNEKIKLQAKDKAFIEWYQKKLVSSAKNVFNRV